MTSFDQINIETPEQIALEFPLAGIGSRFLAFAIDTLIQGVLYIVGLFALFTTLTVAKISPRFFSWIPYAWAPAIAILFVFCIYWGYFALFEIFWNGQTPGKRMISIRVIKDSGRPINAYEAIGRNLLRVVDGLPGMYIVGLVSMMISRRNQRLGDHLVGSIVVHEKRPEDIRPDWAAGDRSAQADSKLSAITAEELVLIETYLQRRDTFGFEVRDQTARQIATRITARTGIERSPDESLDDFLENIAREVRDRARFH